MFVLGGPHNAGGVNHESNAKQIVPILPFLSLQNVSVDMGSFTDPEVIP
jgi:hypothetical protein